MIGSPENLVGLQLLTPQDQLRVRQAFAQGQVPEYAAASGMVSSCKQILQAVPAASGSCKHVQRDIVC
jgi:hypothetical protein